MALPLVGDDLHLEHLRHFTIEYGTRITLKVQSPFEERFTLTDDSQRSSFAAQCPEEGIFLLPLIITRSDVVGLMKMAPSFVAKLIPSEHKKNVDLRRFQCCHSLM